MRLNLAFFFRNVIEINPIGGNYKVTLGKIVLYLVSRYRLYSNSLRWGEYFQQTFCIFRKIEEAGEGQKYHNNHDQCI